VIARPEAGGLIAVAVLSSLTWGVNDIYWYDLLGLAGGGLAELAKWFQYREKVKTALAGIESFVWYAVITLVMIGVGGFLVHVYARSGVSFGDILAINIGATAPLLLNLLTARAPDLRPQPG
jgi:Ni/Fe-hydrogenase subunit HybB-like protein